MPPLKRLMVALPLNVAAPALIVPIVAAPPTVTAPPRISEVSVPTTFTFPPEIPPLEIIALLAKLVEPAPVKLAAVIVPDPPVKLRLLAFDNAPIVKLEPEIVALEVASNESVAVVFKFTAVSVAPVSVTPEVPLSEPFAVANKLPPVTVVAPV